MEADQEYDHRFATASENAAWGIQSSQRVYLKSLNMIDDLNDLVRTFGYFAVNNEQIAQLLNRTQGIVESAQASINRHQDLVNSYITHQFNNVEPKER